jgi:hypothetical protein
VDKTFPALEHILDIAREILFITKRSDTELPFADRVVSHFFMQPTMAKVILLILACQILRCGGLSSSTHASNNYQLSMNHVVSYAEVVLPSNG